MSEKGTLSRRHSGLITKPTAPVNEFSRFKKACIENIKYLEEATKTAHKTLEVYENTIESMKNVISDKNRFTLEKVQLNKEITDLKNQMAELNSKLHDVNKKEKKLGKQVRETKHILESYMMKVGKHKEVNEKTIYKTQKHIRLQTPDDDSMPSTKK